MFDSSRYALRGGHVCVFHGSLHKVNFFEAFESRLDPADSCGVHPSVERLPLQHFYGQQKLPHFADYLTFDQLPARIH